MKYKSVDRLISRRNISPPLSSHVSMALSQRQSKLYGIFALFDFHRYLKNADDYFGNKVALPVDFILDAVVKL